MSGGEIAQTSAWLWTCLDLFILSKWTADLGGSNRDLKQQCSSSGSSVSSFLRCKSWQISLPGFRISLWKLLSGNSARDAQPLLCIKAELKADSLCSYRHKFSYVLQIPCCLILYTHEYICICSETNHRMKTSPGGGMKSMTQWECQIYSLVCAHLKHSLSCTALYTSCVYACLCVGMHTCISSIYVASLTTTWHVMLQNSWLKMAEETGASRGRR